MAIVGNIDTALGKDIYEHEISILIYIYIMIFISTALKGSN